MASLRQRSLS